MATTAQYLEQLQADKQTLVDNLVAKGVDAASDETFTSLVPKVANIQSGGSGADEYWNLTRQTSGWVYSYIKTIPYIDVSGYTTMNKFFNDCFALINIGPLDTSNVTNMSSMCYRCRALITVSLLEAGKVINISSMFMQCNSLTNFGGLKDLGKAYLTTVSANYSNYKLDLSACTKLTHDSLMNVINNLYDIATAGVQAQQLVLGSTNLNKLTAEEKAIATNKGWTLS